MQVRGSCMVTDREKGAFLSFVGKSGREGAFFPFALIAERKKSKFLSKANNAGMDKVSGQSCCHFKCERHRNASFQLIRQNIRNV